jgi:hypothetical protein
MAMQKVTCAPAPAPSPEYMFHKALAWEVGLSRLLVAYIDCRRHDGFSLPAFAEQTFGQRRGNHEGLLTQLRLFIGHPNRNLVPGRSAVNRGLRFQAQSDFKYSTNAAFSDSLSPR